MLTILQYIRNSVMLMLSLLCISGCGHDYDHESIRPYWQNMPEIKQSIRKYFVQWDPQNPSPDASELAGLESFLSSIKSLTDGNIYIEYFPLEMNGIDMPGASQAAFLAESIRTHFNLGAHQVKVIRAGRGSKPGRNSRGGCDPDGGGSVPGVNVVVDNYSMRLPNCDNTQPFGDISHVPITTFGCVTNRNLAIMIDNPKDLVNQRLNDPAPSYTLPQIYPRHYVGINPGSGGNMGNTNSGTGATSGGMGSGGMGSGGMGSGGMGSSGSFY